MFKTKITKEEVNTLPVVIFEGKITLVDDLSKVNSAIGELRKSNVVGLDTETKPSFTRGTHHKVSLVQISTLDHCFLFRLNLIDFPAALAEFLADQSIQKIGLSLRDDLIGLNKRHAFKPAGFIDIQAIAQHYGILELSLQVNIRGKIQVTLPSKIMSLHIVQMQVLQWVDMIKREGIH